MPFATNALVDSYGLTECSTAISVATPMDLQAFPGTLGRPILGVSVEVRDPFGDPVPDGTEGEICVRSPYVMLGYWENDAATSDAIRKDRWLHTGDFGVIENGMVRLTGRRSDLILRGGENVYPVEIEQCLDEHPDVAECAVIGVDHPDLGQEVAAVVVLRPGATVTEDELGSSRPSASPTSRCPRAGASPGNRCRATRPARPCASRSSSEHDTQWRTETDRSPEALGTRRTGQFLRAR